MRKQEFLTLLRERLSGLPQADVEERLAFYSEMIDDRMEEGFSEEEAVGQIGSIEEIVSQIVVETPLSKIVKENVRRKPRRKTWETLLLVLGFPVWLPLLAAAFAVALSVYVVFWSVLISLWAVWVAVAASALACIAAGIVLAIRGSVFAGAAMLGACLVCAGLCVLLFFGCRAATTGTIRLTGKLLLSMKNRFLKKGEI